jgi:hypothetical protein
MRWQDQLRDLGLVTAQQAADAMNADPEFARRQTASVLDDYVLVRAKGGPFTVTVESSSTEPVPLDPA